MMRRMHRGSGVPSCDDLLRCWEVDGGEDGEFYGSSRRQLWCKRGNGDNNRKQNDRTGFVRLGLDAMLSRWVDWCCTVNRDEN